MQTAQTTFVNYWPQTACARAFWGQQELRPYRELLDDTVTRARVRSGDRWLDLGCGGGQLTRALWEKSGGTLTEIVALDCAAANAAAIGKLRRQINPPDHKGRIRFVQADFSSGLATWPDQHFDGVISGLAIQYAESYSAAQGGWTADAYDRLLHEICRVLRVGGQFVFSVNVPEPAWGKVGLHALPWMLESRKPLRLLKNVYRMWRYGAWLKREARRGRFHYLPLKSVVARLRSAGFGDIETQLSYADQANVVRCRRMG